MNDLEKQQQFSMQDLSETITNKPLRDDIYEVQPLQEITPPKYKTITEAANEFRFKNQHIKKIQEAIEKEPDANWIQKTGAGLERGIEQLKHAPAEVRNLLYRTLYSGIDYPNADAQKNLTIAESSAYQIYLDNQALGMEQQAEGTADSIIGNLAQGAFSLGQFALLNLATGGTVGTAIMGAQEAGSQSFVEKDIESGAFESATEYKASAKDNLTAITYGALAGWIEKGIGAEAALGQTWREILKSSGKAAAAKELGKEIIKRGAGEGVEEFLQGEAEWASGKFVGKEDRTVYQGIMDSLISGVYGAVLGGAFGGVSAIVENGVARYYQARSDMIERMTNNGVEPELAAQLADQALTDTTGLIVDELAGRNSLHAHFGEQWDKLVDGVAQAYIAQNWEERFPDKDVKEYARMNAISMVAPVIQLSNRTNMPLKQLLDLTRFRANENALFIDLPNMDDPKALGLEVKKRKAEIKRLRGMPATNAKDTIKRLNEQIKVLETRIRGLGVYDSIQKARMDTKKATLDNNVLASTRPEIMADLGGIRQAEKGESFVYVGNNQVPVRYIVKPMAEVQASHIAGEANPNYTLKELQNRTRGTVTDDAILQNRAANLKPEELGVSPNTQFGAPVVNKNGEVISGNGRIETLRRAYELGNTSYKEMLDKIGYNTEEIERPVLVRETVEDLTPEQQIAIAEASNVSETSAFDHARQAMNDAKLLKKGISDPLSFADELPVNERQAYIRENGQYDMLALQRRFDDAVLAWVIGDTKTFDSLVLSNRLSQKVVKGLSLQGGNIVDFSKNNPALGIKKDLRYALVKSASIKTRGQFIPSVQQQDIESGITFNADALLYAMTFSNNSSELSNFIGQYVQTQQGYIDSQKDSFLADSLPKLSKEDITNQVLLNNPLTASKFDKDGTCTDSNLKAVILNRIPVENVGYGTIKVEPEESQLFQEQFNLADEKNFVIFNPDDVKVIQKFYQRGKANINGYFDAELKTIVIGSSFNFGTLQHEFAHFFLKRVFDIYKTGAGTQEFNDWFSQLSSILDIKADQFALTTPQQEQFARMTEAYLFNKGEFPDGAKPAMQMFFDWCPKEYNELLTVGWKDDKGIYHNSVFNKESLDFFNDMYSLVPELSDSPLARTFTNQTNRNGTKLPASSEAMAEREKLVDENTHKPEELTKLEDEKPEVRQAYLDIQRKEDPEIKEAYDEAIATEKEREKSPIEKFTQYVRIGRGTNTREEMDELAQDYIKKHRENAERVAFGNPIPGGYEEETGSSLGYVENNTGIDRAVLILNMMNEYAPNTPEYGQLYHNFSIYRSYASKSAGLTNDVNTNYYLRGYAEINKTLQTKAALVKYGKSDNAVNLWKRDIDQFISKNIEKVYNTEPESAERDRAIQEFIDEAVATFGGDKALYQEEIRIKSAREKRAFIDWANRTVKKIAKGEISGIDQAKLLDLSIKAQKGASYIDSNNVDEAVAASRSIREWQDFVNQKGLPESFVDKIVGTYLPSAMLSSPSTHALNYISNKFNSLSVQLASRLHYGENVIDKSVLEQEYARLKAIYAESGHNISEDIKPDDVSRLHGEHWQFKKPESALGYLAPMRLLGWSDFYFRAHTYLDVLARIASKDANGDPKKALELFNSYKMMNNTGRAKEARVEAIMTGHIAVFTRNGTLANISAGVRSWLDLINVTNFGEKGHKGLGTLIMPFAKVPSNIVGMGIKAIASPFKLLGKATGLKKDWTLEDSINLTNFGMYGAILGIYLMSGLDYEPPYEPPMKYDHKKPYDSIKIGNTWISVESFGALANPLRFTFTMVDLIRDGKAMQPALSRALQGLKKDIPFADVEFGSDYAFKKPVDWTINQAYNQMSKAVPAIVKKPIAGINRMVGWRIEQDSVLSKKIARQYGLDGEQTSINDWLAWVYRGIKIER